jgi:hypothetical protein
MPEQYDFFVFLEQQPSFIKHRIEHLVGGGLFEVGGNGTVSGQENHTGPPSGLSDALGQLFKVVPIAYKPVDEQDRAPGVFWAEVAGFGLEHDPGSRVPRRFGVVSGNFSVGNVVPKQQTHYDHSECCRDQRAQ